MNVLSKYVLLIFVITVFGACLDEIDLEAPRGLAQSLVIQGKLMKGNPSVVTLSITTVFNFSSIISNTVNAKEVKIIDDQGNALRLEESGPGIYRLEIPFDHPEFKVETGRSYRINISTFDNREFASAFETLNPVLSNGQLDAKLVQREIVINEDILSRPAVEFSVESNFINDAQEKARVLWEVERTYKVTDDSGYLCYVTEPLGATDVVVFDGNEVSGGEVILPIYEEFVGSQMSEGYYLTAYQQSLSEGAYNYFKQVTQLISQSGNMFESPVGKIISNIQNVNNPDEDVFGYFYATEFNAIRVYVDPTEVGNPRTLCPIVRPPGGSECPEPLCCHCPSSKGSTLAKPLFWQK